MQCLEMCNKEEICTLFETWNQAIQSGDPEKVVALYAEDAILLPTVSNRVRHNHAEIRDYFREFLAMKPQGVITECNTRSCGNLAVNSGVYTFTLCPEGQCARAVAARYTFVYQRFGDKWLIVEHHSSVMPEKQEEA